MVSKKNVGKIVVFLKDVTKEDIHKVVNGKFDYKSIEYLQYSDFYNNRKNQFKKLRKLNTDVFLLGIYKSRYLRWSFVFSLMLFITSAKDKYVVDTDGDLKKKSLFTLIYEFFFAAYSLIIQLLSLFLVPFYLMMFKNKSNFSSKFKLLNQKKIAYLRTTDSYNLISGGSLGHTIGIFEGFKRHCKEVLFYGIDDIKDLNVSKSKTIITPPKKLHPIIIFNRFLYSIFFYKKTKQKWDKNIGCIYQRISQDDISGLMLSKKYNVPLILEFNSFLEWELKGNENFFGGLFLYITKKLEAINLKNAELIVTVSDVLKEELIKKGYNENKIIVVYNGVDINKFIPLKSFDKKEELNILKNEKVVGFCGTFGHWHGIDILGKAVKEMLNKNVNCTFLLIGDGLLRNEMELEFKEYNNVIFTHQIPYSEIVNYLSVCDILVSPHSSKKNEKFIGSPTKLFEYLAMEKIVIATDLDQINTIMDPSLKLNDLKKDKIIFKDLGQVGIKVKQGSIEELEYAITYAIENFDKLNFLSKNARRKAINKYTWDECVNKIINKVINE